MGNFFSRRAICGKTKSLSGQIVIWIEFNIFNNFYYQGRTDWNSKKRSTRSQLSCFPLEIGEEQITLGMGIGQHTARGSVPARDGILTGPQTVSNHTLQCGPKPSS